MSAVSRNLFLSLKQDLQSLSNTQEKILPNFKSFSLNSWLHPTKQFWEVDNTQLETVPESFQYTMFLELIVDKLYLIIHLLIHYVSNFSVRSTQEQMQKNIKPVKLTLGRSIEVLWDKLENVMRLSKRELQSMSLESFTQTINEENSYSEFVIPMVKELITALESNSSFTTLKAVKEKLQEDIYGLTDYSCVSKLTNGLIDDAKRLIEQRTCLEEKNARIQSRLKAYYLQHQHSVKTIGKINNLHTKFKKMYNDELKKNKTATSKVKFLEEKVKVQKNNIKEFKDKVKCLEQKVQDNETSSDLLKYDNEVLRTSSDQLKVKNCQFEEEIELWKNRFSDVYLENAQLGLTAQLVEKTRIFKDAMENIHDNFKKFMEKLETLNRRIDEKSNQLKGFIQTFVDVADSQVIKEAGRLRQHESSFIVVGDPISDMRQQIEFNKNTIKQLESDNFQLSETIAKIQSAALQV